jgi:hypothetical protein
MSRRPRYIRSLLRLLELEARQDGRSAALVMADVFAKLRSRLDANPRILLAQHARLAKQQDDWECRCGAGNPAKAEQCRFCGRLKP